MPDIIWLIAIGLIVSGLISMAGRAQARAARQHWAEAAEQLGFAMVASGYRGLSMAGSDGALNAKVEVDAKGGGRRSSSTYTRYRVEYPPLGLGLRLSKESGLHGILKTLGGTDIEIGHEDFDDTFFVKANNEDGARRYFTAQRMASLTALAGQHPGVTVSDHQISLETKGVAKETDRIVATVNQLMATARVLVIDQSESQRVLLGDRETEDAPSEPEREEELERVFDTAEQYAPEETSSAPVPTATSEAPVAADADAVLVATRLFGDRQLGFEVERLFASEFDGRSIDWSGKVKRPAGLMATRAFDDQDRVVLVIEVASLDDELYGTTAVDAIVAFPAGGAPDPGQTVRFTGRLIDVDGVSKDLYVADGRLG